MTEIILLTAALTSGLAAVAVLFRARSSLAGRLFAVGMLVFCADAVLGGLAFRAPTLDDGLYWLKLRLVPLALVPGVWVAFSIVYSRGNYREYLAKWRMTLLVLGIAPLVILLTGSHHLLVASYPDGTRPVIQMEWAAYAIHLLMLGGAVVVLTNFEQTFRASVGTQRWRLKFVVLGLGALFATRVYTSTQALLYRTVIAEMTELNGAALAVACLLVAISMVRTGEFSIDIYPSQAVLHRSVTVIVVGSYLIVVGLLAKLAARLGDVAGFQLNALVVFVALVVLALALMSDRLREKTHAFLIRHFTRPHYDFRKTWNSFTAATAGHASESDASTALAKWTSQTLNALSVSIWVADEARQSLRLSGTTVDPDQLPSPTAADMGANWPMITELAVNLGEIINLGGIQTSGSSLLGELQPRVFPNGGDRLAVPLRAGEESLGVMIVGDRVSGVPFTVEDLDLLHTVAEQATRLLQGIRLSRRLLDAREMEAFQSMSTFFVHDLKNTASSLSLMLQNLPRHFDNPEFRADALRSIRKSVDRINQMIESLSALRRKLVLDPESGDLAELRSAAEQLASDRGLRLETDFQPAGPVRLDREQIGRVLTNLIVNAHEASPGDRPIWVGTAKREGFCRLTVRDEGVGMTPEFIRQQLFRPFQTTKKTGTGIGLYHSKMIVDAHGGRMEVESSPGKGTSISVVLPLLNSADEASHIDR